jgi:hypothetical protein
MGRKIFLFRVNMFENKEYIGLDFRKYKLGRKK